ncbi:hypothetical protein PHMEG_00016691 [Phytophthora megakarya]|uniref:Rab-GAP TBC domain-containing protein n=2 Tax=Phytophthora megakarya TaxID=4795 RepID=A0A225VYM1_9STRA|nr:hypothetical protein PHMEG_00016691 [Phytophthora megakarya]
MEVLRFPSSPPSGKSANVWERLLQTFAVPAPVANRFLPKIKAGPLLLEVGQPPEWKPFEVVLAGASPADLGLYYYPHKDDATPMGCIRLQSAHIDSLEEVLMVVTKDKTWFLCADHVRDASDWSDAICAAIERVSSDGVLHERVTQRRRLDSGVSAVTLCELQSRDTKARVDEFLEVFVRSTREDMCLQAAKGALSWSCMRSLTWKVWLDYLPADVPFNQWTRIAREKRQRYEKERCKYDLFQDLLIGKQRPEEFLTKCESSTDNLLYSIYKDISYNQGMGELLATLVYLLHIEQWPLEEHDLEEVVAGEYDGESDDRMAGSYFFPGDAPTKEHEDTSTEEEEPSYVYVESFINIQNDDSYLDRDIFLRLAPFAGGSGKYYECCRDAAGEIVQELTAAEFIEHDAYLLLEEMMLRMAGTYCPHVPISHRNSKPQVEKPLSSADQLPASPLDDQMNRIHHHILSRCDPPTARHLANLGVEPQIFLLRWVRVLMAREFEMPQVWHIWDAIFSLTPSDFSFINLLCVAVVREFREEILVAEDATNVLLSLRDISNRIQPARLVNNARELYDALLIAAAVEASMQSA